MVLVNFIVNKQIVILYYIKKRYFESLACGVMSKFDETSNNLANGVLLLQKIPYYKLNCLEMASEADCKKFIALPPVQNILNDIWIGKIQIDVGFKTDLKVKSS